MVCHWGWLYSYITIDLWDHHRDMWSKYIWQTIFDAAVCRGCCFVFINAHISEKLEPWQLLMTTLIMWKFKRVVNNNILKILASSWGVIMVISLDHHWASRLIFSSKPIPPAGTLESRMCTTHHDKPFKSITAIIDFKDYSDETFVRKSRSSNIS